MSKKVKNRKYQYCAFPMSTTNLHVSREAHWSWKPFCCRRSDGSSKFTPFSFFCKLRKLQALRTISKTESIVCVGM